MKRFFTYAVTALAVFAALSCQEKAPVDSVTLSSSENISAIWEGGNYDVVFTTNVAWTATCKADGGDAFFSLSKTSGQSGTAALTLTVNRNEVDAVRTGTVTITAGKASVVVKVSQDPVGETSETQEVTVDYSAHSFEYNVGVTPDEVKVSADWITDATVANNVITFTVAENTGTGDRSTVVDIVKVKHTIHLTIIQQPESGVLSDAKASYLGNKAYIYSSETGYTNFQQFLLSFNSEVGTVNLVINENTGDYNNPVDKTVVPTGTYVVDASGLFDDKTFTIAGDYATSFTVNGVVYPVIDGEITIAKDGDKYNVSAALQDESERVHIFTYEGEIASVADDSFGAVAYNTPTYSNYSTYFAGNSYIWDFGIQFSAAPDANSEYICYADFNIVTEAGAAGPAFPTGTFTWAVPEADPAITGNGNMRAIPGTFTFSANDRPQNSVKVNGSPTLTVTKEEDGRYTFALTSNVTLQAYVLDAEGNWTYDENWNPIMEDVATFDWNPTVTITVPEAKAGGMAFPDTDAVTLTTPTINTSYQGFWYKHNGFDETHQVFVLYWSYVSGNYTVYLTVDSDQDYTYEKNYAGRYCSNPVPSATYTFSNTPGPNTLLPTTSRTIIQSSYTGTIYRISGGSVKMTDTAVEFDLTGIVPATGATCKFTGSFETSCMYFLDYSARTPLVIKPIE